MSRRRARGEHMRCGGFGMRINVHYRFGKVPVLALKSGNQVSCITPNRLLTTPKYLLQYSIRTMSSSNINTNTGTDASTSSSAGSSSTPSQSTTTTAAATTTTTTTAGDIAI